MSAWDAAVDVITDVVTSLEERAGRLLLLVLVFALGTCGAVVARGVSDTSSEQVAQRLDAATLDEVRLTVARADGAPASAEATPMRPDGLPVDTVERTQRLPGVRSAAVVTTYPAESLPVTTSTGTGARPTGVPVLGVHGSWVDVLGTELVPASAAWLLEEPRDVVVVGSRVARDLGLAYPGPGSRVFVNGRAFEVVALVGPSDRQPRLDESVLVGTAAGHRLAPGTGEVTVRAWTAPEAARAVSEALPHALDPVEPGRFTTAPVADLRTLRRGIATDLDLSALMISALLIATASVTTANSMAMAVLARTPEIALRRAIGASRRQVARLFLLEGLVVGGAGGLAGAALGVVATVVIAASRDWTPVVSPLLVPLGLALGAAVGLLSAAYPAARASRVMPATAIRAT